MGHGALVLCAGEMAGTDARLQASQSCCSGLYTCSTQEIVIHRDDIIKEGFLVKQLRPQKVCHAPAFAPFPCVAEVQAHEGMEKAKV